MESTIHGTHHLKEADLIDIIKQHFARYGYGFKKMVFGVDLAVRDEPRYEVDLKLEPINPPSEKDPEIEKIYSRLLSSCQFTANPEPIIMQKIFELVKAGEINADEFKDLVNRI